MGGGNGDSMNLADGEPGETYRVLSIPGEKTDADRLVPLAIMPGSEIRLEEKPSFGALMVQKGGDRIAISRDLASRIKVERDG